MFHLSVKTVSRATGATAVAAAAYRGARHLRDERLGIVADYRRKGGVLHTEIIAPDGARGWASDPGRIWNAAERAESRRNAVVAREYEVGLPAGLNHEAHLRIVRRFATEVMEAYQVVNRRANLTP